MPKTDGNGEESSGGSMLDISKLASSVALEGAAAEALKNALAIQSGEEEAAKDELQAEIDAGTAESSGDASADAEASGEVSTEAKE